jgi:hypothetical protein
MEAKLLKNRVRKNLEIFYQQRTERLKPLTLDAVLSRTSHTFWTTESVHVPEIVARLIEDYLLSFEKWWNSLIQEADFCLEAITLRSQITTQRYAYDEELAKTRTRLFVTFINRYCTLDYTIDWSKLLRLNSGKN